MKRCEKDAIANFKIICNKHNIDPIDCFKRFGIIDKDTTQINNIIAKLRKLCNMLLEKYKFWDIGLEIELFGGYDAYLNSTNPKNS